jgi:hypothetical protein
MLPHSYQVPAVILLVLSGAVACFAGYRLFRVVLAIYGFILGAMLASSIMGITNTSGMIVAALLGGIVGALLLVFAYFVGIALAGAGLGAVVAHVGWGQVRPGDPPALALITLAVIGAIVAMLLQRYVIIVATAFAGAWTMIIGGLATAGERVAARGGPGAEAWILYPMMPASADRWWPFAWIALGIVGAVVQIGVTGRRR